MLRTKRKYLRLDVANKYDYPGRHIKPMGFYLIQLPGNGEHYVFVLHLDMVSENSDSVIVVVSSSLPLRTFGCQRAL